MNVRIDLIKTLNTALSMFKWSVCNSLSHNLSLERLSSLNVHEDGLTPSILAMLVTSTVREPNCYSKPAKKLGLQK